MIYVQLCIQNKYRILSEYFPDKMPFLEFQDSYVLVSSQLDRVVAGTKLDFFLGIIRSADLRRHHKASSAPTREQRLRTRALRQRQGDGRHSVTTVVALWWLPGGSLVVAEEAW